jgi:hypothetical protein
VITGDSTSQVAGKSIDCTSSQQTQEDFVLRTKTTFLTLFHCLYGYPITWPPCRSSEGEESLVRGNADCCSPPHQDGRAACRAAGGGVFCRSLHAWALGEALRVDVVDELIAKFWK